MVSFHWTTWPWRGGHFGPFAMKQEVVVTNLYIIRSAPNFSGMMRVQSWRHIHVHIDSWPRPNTLATPPFITHEPFVVESRGWYHITQQRVHVSLVKVLPAPYTQAPPPWLTNEAFVVDSCERCHTTQQRVPDKLVKVIPAPYTLAPPPFITAFVVESCGRRRCSRRSSGFIVPGRVSRRPASTPDARRGARARSSLLAALIRARAPTTSGQRRPYWNWRNYYYSFQANESRFWGLCHARKVVKLGTLIRRGEKFDIFRVSDSDFAKWLASAP